MPIRCSGSPAGNAGSDGNLDYCGSRHRWIFTLALEAPQEAWIAWSFVGGLLMLLLYLWAASQSCRFFIEARRSGLIELLLATPLNEVNIVRGHWRGLLRMFAAPVLILIGLQLAGVALSQTSMQRMMSTVSSRTVTTNSAGSTTVTVNATSGPSTTPGRKTQQR